MMKNRRGLSFIVIGILLIIGAMVLTGYNYIQEYRAGKAAQSIVAELEEEIPEQENQPSSDGSVPDYILHPEMEMPVMEKDGQDYIGTLEIPALDLKLPVISQWSYPSLRIAPCRYTGSAYLSNMVIAAHNYKTHFGRLRELQLGDEIRFTDVDGNEFLYSVEELEILSPTAVEEMTDSEWDLTLFTCTIGGKTRVTVRCSEQE
jgi:sortase A